MYAALQREGAIVSPLGPVWSGSRTLLHFADALARRTLRKSYDFRHSMVVAKEYALRFEKKLRALDADVLFAPAASCEVSFLDTQLPIVYLSDVLINDFRDYYPTCSNLFEFSAREGEHIESRAISKAEAFICPSEWTARCAATIYRVPQDRIHVFPFGANLSPVPSFEEATRRKDGATCRLLFLGVDWIRKGGEIAFQVLKYLLDAGINTELTVCGCQPPYDVTHPKLTVIRYLNRRDASQAAQLRRLLDEATFLLLPTQAEAFGIVFSEASAWGVPSITRNTGGVGGAVRDGINGYKLAAEHGSSAYAELILTLYRDSESYHALRISTRQEYDRRLNWNSWGASVYRVLRDVARARH